MRALTLNVYSIEDAKVQTFVCSPPASSYFQELAVSLVEQCQVRSIARSHPHMLILHPSAHGAARLLGLAWRHTQALHCHQAAPALSCRGWTVHWPAFRRGAAPPNTLWRRRSRRWRTCFRTATTSSARVHAGPFSNVILSQWYLACYWRKLWRIHEPW